MVLQLHQVFNDNTVSAAAGGASDTHHLAISEPNWDDKGLIIQGQMLTSFGSAVDAWGNLGDNPDTTAAIRDMGFVMEGIPGATPDRGGHRHSTDDEDFWPFDPSNDPPANEFRSLLKEENIDATSWSAVHTTRMNATDGEFAGTWTRASSTWSRYWRAGDNWLQGQSALFIFRDFPQTQRSAAHVKATFYDAAYAANVYSMEGHTFHAETDYALVFLYINHSDGGTAITALSHSFPNGTGPTADWVGPQVTGNVASSAHHNGTSGYANVAAEFGATMDCDVTATGGDGHNAHFMVIEVSRDTEINSDFGDGGAPPPADSAVSGFPRRKTRRQNRRVKRLKAKLQARNLAIQRAAADPTGKSLPGQCGTNASCIDWEDYLK